jgi:peptidoglycan/xylan/chitin deacetylase (PgdA/CDA1 family)
LPLPQHSSQGKYSSHFHSLGKILLILLSVKSIFLLIGIVLNFQVPFLLPTIVVMLLIFFVTLAVSMPALGIFERSLVSGSTHTNRMSITFDDGPHPLHTLRILEILKRHDAKATFFVIGSRAEKYPEVVMEIARQGHQLENHSYAHEHMGAFRFPHTVINDLEKTQKIIQELSGRTPRWFRPPFGVISPRIASAARRAGLKVCAWTYRAGDGVSWRCPKKMFQRAKGEVTSGAILMLHDSLGDSPVPPVSLEFLADLLQEIREKGLSAVTLDDLLEENSPSEAFDLDKIKIQKISC